MSTIFDRSCKMIMRIYYMVCPAAPFSILEKTSKTTKKHIISLQRLRTFQGEIGVRQSNHLSAAHFSMYFEFRCDALSATSEKNQPPACLILHSTSKIESEIRMWCPSQATRLFPKLPKHHSGQILIFTNLDFPVIFGDFPY